jgi:poly(A) polymerase
LIGWASTVGGDAAPDPRADEGWLGLLRAAGWEAPRFPLKGRDAVQLGVAPGPDVGRLVTQVEDWWIAGDFAADRAACLEKLRELSAAA